MTSVLQDLVSPPQGVKTQIIELTPALAAFLLENNTNNRPMRMAHVQAMAEDIIKGLWVLNGDAILAMAAGWCMNIYTIATSPEIFPLTGMMILRIVGIFVAPLGGVIGYF